MSAGEPITGADGGVDRPETARGVDPRIAALGARFWPKVKLSGPVASPATCWRFVGGESPQRGGRPRLDPDAMTAAKFWIRGHVIPAARVAYELAGYGSTERLALCNECGDEACVRPTHQTRRRYQSGAKGRSVLGYVLRDGPGLDEPVPEASPAPRVAPRPAPVPPPPAPDYGHAATLLTRRAAAARLTQDVTDAELRAALEDPAALVLLFGTKEIVAGAVRGQGWIVGVPWGVYRGEEPCALLREALGAMPHRPAVQPGRAA